MSVRIGQVQNTNKEKRQVRVFFAYVGIMSGWLTVLQSPPAVTINDSKTTPVHNHAMDITPWMPKIGDNVLCLYVPGFNADGYVLGAL
ncbi:MAG: hypothetical protein DBX61_11820 [Clostridiales bacterium]|nr:MAG: hypothetical protein DBX61_11820 [Clostridiales bacterium]